MSDTLALPVPYRCRGLVSDAEWARIVAFMDVLHFQAGEALVREGELGRDLFVVVEGEARIHKGDTELGTARAGELVGELGLILGRPRAATIDARSDADPHSQSSDGQRSCNSRQNCGLMSTARNLPPAGRRAMTSRVNTPVPGPSSTM